MLRAGVAVGCGTPDVGSFSAEWVNVGGETPKVGGMFATKRVAATPTGATATGLGVDQPSLAP